MHPVERWKGAPPDPTRTRPGRKAGPPGGPVERPAPILASMGRIYLGLALALLSSAASPQVARRPPLDPATHVSPSGRHVLHVDPTEPDGAGPARYELRRDGEVVWSATLPFTFREAVVTEQGRALGYALTDGLGMGGGGDFVVAVLSAGGDVLHEDRTARRPHAVHGPFVPVGRGVVGSGERAFVRVHDPKSHAAEAWWEYDLAAAERTRVFVLRDELGPDPAWRSPYAVRGVPGGRAERLAVRPRPSHGRGARPRHRRPRALPLRAGAGGLRARPRGSWA